MDLKKTILKIKLKQSSENNDMMYNVILYIINITILSNFNKIELFGFYYSHLTMCIND